MDTSIAFARHWYEFLSTHESSNFVFIHLSVLIDRNFSGEGKKRCGWRVKIGRKSFFGFSCLNVNNVSTLTCHSAFLSQGLIHLNGLVLIQGFTLVGKSLMSAELSGLCEAAVTTLTPVTHTERERWKKHKNDNIFRNNKKSSWPSTKALKATRTWMTENPHRYKDS